MKNSTIYASPAPPRLDPRPHADLRAQTRQLAGEHLRNVELAPAIRRSQELQNSLLTEYAGHSPENIELLKKCLQEVSIMGINFVIPKRRVLLSVHEILRLSNLGFRFGKLDPDFEIHLQQGRRIPFFQGEPLPKQNWEQKFACVLKHKICLELLQEYRSALEIINQQRQQTLESKNKNSSLNKELRQQAEENMFEFKVPTKFDLLDPPLIPMEESLFAHDQQVMEATLSDVAKKVLEMQNQRELPSLFQETTLSEIQSVPHHVMILLDMSASTFEKEIFKLSNLVCAELLRTLPAYLPDSTLSILPYSDGAQGVMNNFQNFIAPGGTTAYDAIFSFSQQLLGKTEGHRVVIHLSDGLPNSLEDACQQAKQFPTLNIHYGQIIFGHTKRVGDLSDYLFVDEATTSGQDRDSTRFEKYVSHFTDVALASQGEQIILWVMQHLDEAVIAMLDLFIGQYFLQQASPETTDSEDTPTSL